jgi:carboxyl-terminal processing protease
MPPRPAPLKLAPSLLATVLALLLALPAAAAEPPRTGPAGYNKALTEAVLHDAFVALRDRHLSAVRLADMSAAALAGMAALDPSAAVTRRGDMVRLMLDGRLVAAWRAPAATDALAWAQLTAGLAKAAQAAPGIRRAGQGPLLRAMFDEMTASLDPYTRYVPPEEARESRSRRQGEGGIGLRAVPAEGGALVLEVLPDSPAAHAGLSEGDRILAIDGAGTRGLSSTQLAARLAGDEDTRLVLTVRQGSSRRSLTLIRALIVPETVFAERQGSVLVLRLSGFNELTDQRLSRHVLAAAHLQGLSGIVLDLRGNRGGLLRQAVGVVDVFLAEGEVAATRGRHPEAARAYVAGGADLAGGLPLAVLIDGRTASAAEIVAAALQERGRAAVVGSVSQGKGLVQTVLRLPDDGELVVSWSRVLVPPGRPLHELGVLPALCTTLGPEAQAEQLAQLRQGLSPMAESLAALRALRAPPSRAEVARLREACPPQDLAQPGGTALQAAMMLLADQAAMATALGRAHSQPQRRAETLAGGN